MMDRNGCPVHRSHFHGNGTCDAIRAANKQEDRRAEAAGRTGMESELVPYPGAPEPAAGGGYGPQHEWTAAEEAGLSTAPQESFTDPLTAGEAARSSWGRTMLMGAVECFSLVSPVTPVTTSSFSCRWRKNTSVESSA